MADQTLTSKKRKRQLINHPLLGIFTRSKSLIHVHRHRSGRSWSDSSPLLSQSKRPRSVHHSSTPLVRDLRSRRVFSDGIDFDSSDSQGKTTPPDTDLFTAPPSEGFGIRKDRNDASEQPPKQEVGLRSRMRLFKAPGSFSYRRLLPYLKDVSKDYNCGGLDLGQCSNAEKYREEKPVSSCLVEDNSAKFVYELNAKSVEGFKGSSVGEDGDQLAAMVVNVGEQTFDFKGFRNDQNLIDSKTDLCVNRDVLVSDSFGASAKATDDEEDGDTADHLNNLDSKFAIADENCDEKDRDGDVSFGGAGQLKGGEAITDAEMDEDTDVSPTVSNLPDQKPNNQSNVLKTSPDADIHDKPEFDESNGNGLKSSLRTADNAIVKPMEASINKNNSNGSILPKKWDLGRCSRQKVFKVPGSMSYKRMLPFLIDLAQDDSFAFGKDHHMKLERCSEEKPTSQSLVSVNQETKIKSSDVSVIAEPGILESSDVSNTISSSTNNHESGGLDHRVNESPDICASLQEDKVQIEQGMSSPQLRKIECNEPATRLPSPLDSGSPSKEESNIIPNELSVHTGEDCTQLVSRVSDAEVDKDTDISHTVSNVPDQKPNDQSNDLKTPPDAVISDKLELDKSNGNGLKSSLRTADNSFVKPIEGSINKNNSYGNSPPRKQDLGRCSRQKVFKVPGSMSYRRMLPFLIDITQDDSCAFGKDFHMKQERCSEEKPTSQSLVSDNHEMKIKSADVTSIAEPDILESCDTSNTISASPSNQDSGVLDHCVNESPDLCASLHEDDVQIEPDPPSPQLMDVNCESNAAATPLPSPLDSTKEVSNFVSNELSVDSGEDCMQLHCQSLPTTALRKGILKRTPQGCRGLCTCLNCSSFRLNAERAFEFSSNQMQDAEEVALDLIKELSYMRNMLEKNTAIVANGSSVVCIDQVKEACKRACEAEELVRTRLSQMNFDLKAHCKMTCPQRPRVRFASHVEEQVITYANLPRK